MGKWWSILFAVTMGACGMLFVVAPMFGWWLPIVASTHGPGIDSLFYIILGITAFFFVLTETILCVFMFKYCCSQKGVEKPYKGPGVFAKAFAPVTRILNDQHKVEMGWTVVPALILLYISFAQVNAWAEAKYQSRMPQFLQGEKDNRPLQVDVTARQWEWRTRYPSSERFEAWMAGDKRAETENDFKSFAKFEQNDDIGGVNELHVWKGHPVVVMLSTRDVIHSFNLPHMRVKQDSLPGKQIPVWFTPTKFNTKFDGDLGVWRDGYNPETERYDNQYVWDLACAELCGWGHYRMVGRLYVHETKEDFLSWLKSVEAARNFGKK